MEVFYTFREIDIAKVNIFLIFMSFNSKCVTSHLDLPLGICF